MTLTAGKKQGITLYAYVLLIMCEYCGKSVAVLDYK